MNRPEGNKPPEAGENTTHRAVPLSRREFLLGAAGLTTLGVGACRESRRPSPSADVFIGRALTYDADLTGIMLEGLKACGIQRDRVSGKTVLLKPNLVETAVGQPHINTHPKFVVAAAEAFRRLDARQVLVGEGQGHRRDSWLVLEESGTEAALREAKLEYIDLNHDDLYTVDNLARHSGLKQLTFPVTLKRADLIVSLPKLKVHHWAGVTCSMKNLFGVMPGIKYGWPKNVLHAVGIPEAIVDIYQTLAPHIAMVDGIVGMDGDGPIMGNPRPASVVIVGTNYPAVDATATRVMRLNVDAVAYLQLAKGRLGPVDEAEIRQTGEPVASVATRFEVLDEPHLRPLRTSA